MPEWLVFEYICSITLLPYRLLSNSGFEFSPDKKPIFHLALTNVVIWPIKIIILVVLVISLSGFIRALVKVLISWE